MADDHNVPQTEMQGSDPQLRNSRTHDNLKVAYMSEAAASNRLDSFADMAEIEGHAEVATLLRDLAEMERLHAQGHLDFLRRVGDPLTDGPIGDTRRNMEASAAGHLEQSENQYPAMVRTAQAEGFTEISDWFRTLAKAKVAQAARIQEYLGELKD